MSKLDFVSKAESASNTLEVSEVRSLLLEHVAGRCRPSANSEAEEALLALGSQSSNSHLPVACGCVAPSLRFKLKYAYSSVRINIEPLCRHCCQSVTSCVM